MIYVVEALTGEGRGPYKIGFTKSKESMSGRLSSLRTGGANKLKLLALVEGDRAHEAAIHGLLAPFRVRGEWFNHRPNIDDPLLDHVITLMSWRGDPTMHMGR